MARGDQSLMGRLFRRKSAVEGESTDGGHAGEIDVLSARAASSDDSSGATGDDTSAPEDGTTGDDTSSPENGTTGDDSSDGGEFVISDGSDDGGEFVISDGSDDGSAVISADDDGSAVISADDEGEFTISDGSAEGDGSSDSTSGDSAVISADDDGSFTISDGSSEGDGSSDSTSGDSAVIGDGSSDSDATISDGSSEGDAPVLTGDDTDTGDQIDPNVPVQEADGPSAADLGIGVGRGTTSQPFDPQSELARQAHQIKEATEPQLDPEVVQARLGGLGPQPPEPPGPVDEAPDQLAFGRGELGATKGAELPSEPAADVDVRSQLEPVERFSTEAPDGLDQVSQEPGDAGLDPVGGVPLDDGAVDGTIDDHSDSPDLPIG